MQNIIRPAQHHRRWPGSIAGTGHLVGRALSVPFGAHRWSSWAAQWSAQPQSLEPLPCTQGGATRGVAAGDCVGMILFESHSPAAGHPNSSSCRCRHELRTPTRRIRTASAQVAQARQIRRTRALEATVQGCDRATPGGTRCCNWRGWMPETSRGNARARRWQT